jgi:hypothetical protein
VPTQETSAFEGHPPLLACERLSGIDVPDHLRRAGDDYELRYIERIGHDRRYPVTRDWPHLVDQLLDDIGRRYERRCGSSAIRSAATCR